MRDELKQLLYSLTRNQETGCWVTGDDDPELAQEVREVLWEYSFGKPTRGKRPVSNCGNDDCVCPRHLELTRETRALRVARVCGECRHIRYKGHQLITLETGTCNQWKDSGRLAVSSKAEGCPLWARRSKQRRTRDAGDHQTTQTFLQEYNQGVVGRRKKKNG